MFKPAMATVFLLVGVLGPAVPTHADAAARAGAAASGMQSTGLVTMAPTPAATATQPPDARRQLEGPIDVAAGPLAVKASAVVVAETARESRIATPVFPELEDNARRRHLRVDKNNARGFAEVRTVVLNLAPQGPVPLVEAATVRSAAVARCQGNQALFDTDFDVRELKVLGRATSSNVVDQPIGAGPDPQLLISVKQGEAGRLPSGGVFMNGVRVTIPALDVDIVLARAEATMPTPCGAGGSVAEPTRLGRPLVAKRQTTPGTGGSPVLLPLGVAMAVLGSALHIVNRRAGRGPGGGPA